jgi:hypothetical protein
MYSIKVGGIAPHVSELSEELALKKDCWPTSSLNLLRGASIAN